MTMKRLFILVILLAMMPFAGTNAQDARNRVTSTIIADALATLPAETPEAYNKTMDELARTGAEGMETICAMLKQAAEGVNNSAIEYAIAYSIAELFTPSAACFNIAQMVSMPSAPVRANSSIVLL